MASKSSSQYKLRITLRDGREYAWITAKMPRHWKSWVMQQLPYGTDFQGASWRREIL